MQLLAGGRDRAVVVAVLLVAGLILLALGLGWGLLRLVVG
jgi:hypothetical protein